MKKYTISVLADVTIRFIVECENEEQAKSKIDALTYDELVDQGVINIYYTEEIDIDQDIKEYEEKDFDDLTAPKENVA